MRFLQVEAVRWVMKLFQFMVAILVYSLAEIEPDPCFVGIAQRSHHVIAVNSPVLYHIGSLCRSKAPVLLLL